MAESVGVVIVAFHPDAPRLTRLCAAYAPQADRIVVVDNTPGGGSLEAGIHALAHVLSMGSNRGIAAAFNAGM
ncbi:hypothetical protein, partial [Klebsiella pneumoniae]|uniref:hypothetical protein n=1 Tax=Klebsiella pneumoniae TaxID=573 RepID=UPI003EE36D63